jgi:hypothetical protein
MCNNYFSTEKRWWWLEFYEKNTMLVWCYGEAVPRARKVNFSISQYCMHEYSSQRLGEVITTDFIDGFITNNFSLLYVPNKTPNLPNVKAFPSGMCPVNVRKIDIKQVLKYTDHDHQDFWTTLAWETTGKEDQDE